jgi:hypothetical protein
LRSAHDALLRELDRLEGCDEWAVHVYADPAVVRKRIATADPEIARLREERAGAAPGRAYFLERQLRDELDAATEQALVTLAETVFDRLADCALVGQVSPTGSVADASDDAEILRAAFLVARENAERFEEEVRCVASADASEGLRCECSGPWPPYSFAAQSDKEAR